MNGYEDYRDKNGDHLESARRADTHVRLGKHAGHQPAASEAEHAGHGDATHTAGHAGHGDATHATGHEQHAMPHGGHATPEGEHAEGHARGHDRHAGHSVEMFRTRFWVSLALTIPVLLYARPLWELLGLDAPDLPGGDPVAFGFATAIHLYGGRKERPRRARPERSGAGEAA